MRKWLQLAFLLLLLPLVTRGQGGTTTVTATVLDPNGSPYTNSQVNITFFDPGTSGKLPLLNGSTFQQSFTIYATDSFAKFTETIPDNGVIDSSSGTVNTQWKFSICYSDRVTCFTYTTHIDCAHNLPVTCNAGVEDLTLPIQAVAAYLPFNSILVQNNTFTGTNTFNGTTIFNGLVFVHNAITIDPCDLKLLPGPVTICSNATAPRTWNIQDVSDTFVGRTTVDTLTNKTINVANNVLNTTTNVAGHYLRNNGTQYVDVPASTVAADVSSSVTGGTGCAANFFAIGFSSGLNLSCRQPAFSDLSGNISVSQMANGTGASASTAFFGDNSWKTIGSFVGIIRTATSAGCTTQTTSNSNCDVVLSWSGGGFADTSYVVQCNFKDTAMQASGGDGSSGEVGALVIRTFTTTTVTATLINLRSVGITAAATTIYCTGVHL